MTQPQSISTPKLENTYELTSTFSVEHPLKNSLMLEMQSDSVLGSWQY